MIEELESRVAASVVWAPKNVKRKQSTGTARSTLLAVSFFGRRLPS
jgi:hypothetical protein